MHLYQTNPYGGSPVPLWARIRKNRDTLYFLVKSFQEDQIAVAREHCVWATGTRNEKALVQAFDSSPFVVLLFSVNGSGRFFGWALMKSRPGASVVKGPLFTTADGRPFPGRHFDIRWISTNEMPFRCFDHVANALNDDRPVKVGRDGQQLSWDCGGRVLDIYEHTNDSRATDLAMPNIARQIPFLPSAASGELKAADQLDWTRHDHSQSPPPPPPAENISTDDDFRGPSWEDLLEVNPLLAIFPVDLTKMTYEGYTAIFERSARESEMLPRGPLRNRRDRFFNQIQNHSDWSDEAALQCGVSKLQFVQELERLANES